MDIAKQYLPAFAAAAALAVGVAACGDADSPSTAAEGEGRALSGSIAGAGASSQAAAEEAWIAAFQDRHPGVTVSYDPVGSGAGREQFAAGAVAFAGTDAALEGEELAAAGRRCGGLDNLIEAPVYVSPIAIAYNLPGVEELNLTPETLARILKGEITRWDDPAIAATNPGADLPGERITVVHRSDESGTTENLAEYLAAAAGEVWDFEVSGDWPVDGQEAAQGTSGVVAAVRNGQGTIGYADASQAGDLGVARIRVGDEFVAPTAEAAAAILDASQETDDPGRFVFTYELARDTTDAGAYPIVLVSYELACTRYDSPAEAALVKAFLSYVISEEGQQAAARAAGSAPISAELRRKLEPAVEAIGGDA